MRDVFQGAWVAPLLGVVLAVSAIASHPTAYAAQAAAKAVDEIPTFKYDPDWPKPLPNAWVTGQVGGVFMEKNDHLWVAQRPATTTGITERYVLTEGGSCCSPPPPIIEYDPEGNMVQAWGPIHIQDPQTKKQALLPKQVSGPYPEDMWPVSEHAVYVDYKNNVWVVSNAAPSQVVKMTRDGKFIMRIGKEQAKSSNDKENLAGPTGVYVDPKANEVFISDGYQNRRVVVFDADTGKYKRHWGAYGKRPPDGPQQSGIESVDPVKQKEQFAVTHCIVAGNDGLLYVCDRANSRIQVFKKDGTYVREAFIQPREKGLGTLCGLAFSSDPEQRFIYIANPADKNIIIVRHSDLKVLGTFGVGGREGGRFMEVHSLAVDSHGNIYTGETTGNNRVQRFLFTGMKPLSK